MAEPRLTITQSEFDEMQKEKEVLKSFVGSQIDALFNSFTRRIRIARDALAAPVPAAAAPAPAPAPIVTTQPANNSTSSSNSLGQPPPPPPNAAAFNIGAPLAIVPDASAPGGFRIQLVVSSQDLVSPFTPAAAAPAAPTQPLPAGLQQQQQQQPTAFPIGPASTARTVELPAQQKQQQLALPASKAPLTTTISAVDDVKVDDGVKVENESEVIEIFDSDDEDEDMSPCDCAECKGKGGAAGDLVEPNQQSDGENYDDLPSFEVFAEQDHHQTAGGGSSTGQSTQPAVTAVSNTEPNNSSSSSIPSSIDLPQIRQSLNCKIQQTLAKNCPQPPPQQPEPALEPPAKKRYRQRAIVPRDDGFFCRRCEVGFADKYAIRHHQTTVHGWGGVRKKKVATDGNVVAVQNGGGAGGPQQSLLNNNSNNVSQQPTTTQQQPLGGGGGGGI